MYYLLSFDIFNMVSKGDTLYKYFDTDDSLVIGTIVKRPSKHVKSPYMADVILDSTNEEILAHTPALGCNGYVDKEKKVLLIKTHGKNTKSSHRIDFAYDSACVGTNPNISNDIVGNLLKNYKLPQFTNYDINTIKREKTVLNSRFDVYFEDKDDNKYYIEVKTAPVKDHNNNCAIFPKGYRKKKDESYSPRAIKHLEELTHLSKTDEKNKCFLIFIVPRNDVDYFTPCKEDPLYCEAYLNAVKAGVRMIAFSTTINESKNSIVFNRFEKIKFSWKPK